MTSYRLLPGADGSEQPSYYSNRLYREEKYAVERLKTLGRPLPGGTGCAKSSTRERVAMLRARDRSVMLAVPAAWAGQRMGELIGVAAKTKTVHRSLQFQGRKL